MRIYVSHARSGNGGKMEIYRHYFGRKLFLEKNYALFSAFCTRCCGWVGGCMLAFVSPPSHFKLFFSHFATSTHHSAIIIRSLSFDIYTKSPLQDFVFFRSFFSFFFCSSFERKNHLLHSQKNFSHTLWSAFISQRFRNYFRNEIVLHGTISAEKCPCDDCTCTVYVYSRKNFLFDYTWFFEYFNATCQSRIK